MQDQDAVPRHSTGAYHRIEVVTGHERRRAYSDVEKARLIAEASEPGANVAEIAQRHGVNTSLLYRWRRHGSAGRAARLKPPPLVPVRIGADLAPAPLVAGQDAGAAAAQLVEIALPNGCVVRVDQQVDAKALRRIVAALRG